MTDDNDPKQNSNQPLVNNIFTQVISTETTQGSSATDGGYVLFRAEVTRQEVSRHLTWTAIKDAWTSFEI